MLRKGKAAKVSFATQVGAACIHCRGERVERLRNKALTGIVGGRKAPYFNNLIKERGFLSDLKVRVSAS